MKKNEYLNISIMVTFCFKSFMKTPICINLLLDRKKETHLNKIDISVYVK